MASKNSIQVAIKVRPLFGKEKDQQCLWRAVNNSIQLADSQTEPCYFDHIFDQDVTNEIIFDKMAKQIVHSAIKGFNGTIFAYGQTSSGKTYTMMGNEENPGVMVLAAKEVFNEIERTQDRQFLLRVCYIEIYNEKIYDLLNKKNQDLKIHETSTGMVSVNCEEFIIRSENDLLYHLDKGSKERTVGETNMNERSSRSHAIFRIIIESRKIDRSEDDAVTQSVINLVDLAGSERADQTGARGTRLKEGGHINKSLLFLSTVIKRLSENEEDKYISFRDSKLTRILQASLGGNALTAIICTIKPNAVEETQSTLNFALRAKAIKNKPRVNEIVSDATMMKRLENEIKILKNRLEEEQRKNESQVKVSQLKQRIKDEYLKIISCNSLHSTRSRDNRRRTWCYSSTNLGASALSKQSWALPLPAIASGLPPTSRLQPPKTSHYNTPLITIRAQTEPQSAPKNEWVLPIGTDNYSEINEEFGPAELVDFKMLAAEKTPPNEKITRNISLTPKLISCAKSTLQKVENELLELQFFTNLENKEEVQHEPLLTLKHKVDTLSERNAELEKEKREYLQLEKEIEIISESLVATQNKVEILTQRNDELEKEKLEHLELKNTIEKATENLTATAMRCNDLQAEVFELKNSNKIANEKIDKYEAELTELKTTNEKLEMENRDAVTLEFEFKRHQNKAKSRENELLEVLTDKQKEITKLEKSLNTFKANSLQNTNDDLNRNDRAAEDRKICMKCEDLQRLLDENKKITLEFEQLTLEYEKLTLEYENFKLSYVEIEKENETNKQKIVHLEEVQESENAACAKLLLDVEELKLKLTQVQRDYDVLSIQNSSKHEECMSVNKQIQMAREEMLVLEEKYSKLELNWQEQQQTVKDIEAQYAHIQTKYEQLQTQYEELEATKCQSLADYQNLEKENFDLQTDIEDLKKKVHDAQHRLLESNTKYEQVAKETKTANEEYSSKNLKAQVENENIKKELLEIQTQFYDLQKEYDNLSNQLIDNLQDNDNLKAENIRFKEKLKDYEVEGQEVTRAETEINKMKLQLETILSNERNVILKSPSPFRNILLCSSGVSSEVDEDDIDVSQSQELLRNFFELSEYLAEIELELSNGKTKLFRSTCKNFDPSMSYKMYLKNILDVQKPQKQFNMKIENMPLQGYFKQHSFHIVEFRGAEKFSELEERISIDINGCESMTEYVEKLKLEIIELKKINDHDRLSNKSLLESTERAVSEMREQITQLSAELLEKSIFVENCACKNYEKQIENLEKEKADITVVYQELQDKFNSTFNSLFITNNTAESIDIKSTDNSKIRKDLEKLKLSEQELVEAYDLQTKTLEEITQRCVDMEADLESARAEFYSKEKEFKQEYQQLQLENLQQIELSANEYSDKMKKYNEEWDQRKNEYEQTIQNLQNQMDVLKQIPTNPGELKMEIKQEKSACNEKTENLDVDVQLQSGQEQQTVLLTEDIENKQIKCILEEEQLDLIQKLNTSVELFETMKEENRTKCEEISLLHSRIVYLEELLVDNKVVHEAITRENTALKTEIDDIKYDLNCIPELHNRNQDLSHEVEKLNLEQSQLKEKLQKAETQIQEFYAEAAHRDALIQTLKTKLTDLEVTKEETKSLTTDFDNLKQEHKQLHNKLQKSEQQIQELCSEDSIREELIQTLQTKLNNMTVLEDGKKMFETQIMHLQGLVNSLQEKEVEMLKEVVDLRQKVEILPENALKLDNVVSISQMEKSVLEEKLKQITSDYNLLQTDKILLETKVDGLTKERDSLHEQCIDLRREKTSLEEHLKQLKEKENDEAVLGPFMEDKTELLHNLCCITEKLEAAKKQLDEKETIFLQVSEEKIQIQQDLHSLKESISKAIEEKNKKLEGEEKQKEKCKEENINLCRELEAVQCDFSKAKEESRKQQQKIEESQRAIAELRQDVAKLEEEKREQQLTLNKVKEKNTKLQQDLKALKKSLSEVVEQKQLEFKNLEASYQKTQKQNFELQLQLNALTADLGNFKENQEEKLTENTRLQTELLATRESLNQLEGELKERIVHYQNLQEDKNKLEATFNVIKKTQTGALCSLQNEKDKLYKTLQQYEEENKVFKEKEETLKQKVESLCQQLHEVRSKVHSYEKLILEREELESILSSTTSENRKVQQEIAQLTSQQYAYISKIENLSCETELLRNKAEEKAVSEIKLSQLIETLQGEQACLKKEYHVLKSAFEELETKCDSLQSSNTQLENLNQKINEQLNLTKEKLKEFNSIQAELRKLQVQHSELQKISKKTIEETGRCSFALREDVDHNKQNQISNAIILEMESKLHSLSEENLKLSTNIEVIKKEKHSLEEKLEERAVRNFEHDLQRQAIDATANTSADSKISYSPRGGRRSHERMSLDKVANNSLEEKLSAIQLKNSAKAERKNRRLSTHDERRRLSYWGEAIDKQTMTDTSDSGCNCTELDRKLKECERNLFIKSSQVTALNMELKNHPLKDENSALKKRLQEEQEKHRVEVKRCKNKLYEQTAKAEKAMATAAHATALTAHAVVNASLCAEKEATPILPKILADAEAQTEGELNITIQTLQGKYTDLKNICRYRYNLIKELERKVAEKENSDDNCPSVLQANQLKMLNNERESLKIELNTLKEKYDKAKKVLLSRREEILTLRAQLVQLNK